MRIFFGLFCRTIECKKPCGTNIWGFKRYSGSCYGSYRISSVTYKRLLESHIFWKTKRQSFLSIISIDQFFAFCRVWPTWSNIMQGSTKFFDNHCASYNIIFLVPKMSIETNISKNAVFTRTKVFGPFFVVLSSVTNLKGFFWASKGFVDIHCWSISIISLTPKRLLETQNFEKKAIWQILWK